MTHPPTDNNPDNLSNDAPSGVPPAAPYRGTPESLASELRTIAQSVNIAAVSDDAWPQLAKYCLLVWDWNEKINLTRHTDPDRFVKRDLLDSVMLAGHLAQNEEILDIGTGGGVPGILLAILRPDIQVTLCDSVAKKAKVAEQIVDDLGLKVPVYPQSVTKVLEDFRYDSLVARAVGPLARLCGWLKEDWHKIGRLLAIKGPKWVEERGEARHRGLLKGVDLRRLVSYPMPDTDSESTILQLSRQRGPHPVEEI